MRELRGEPGGYPVRVGAGLLDALGEETARVAQGKAFLLADAHVDAHYGARAEASLARAGFSVCRHVIAAGERAKTLATLRDIYARMAGFAMTRSDVLVALGGGVTGDLGALAAGTFLRGVKLVHAPTTVIALVDSCVGGKAAVDLPEGKNLVGCFYHPHAVVADPALLKTLPAAEFAGGMAEVIKYAAIADAALFETLERAQGRADVTARMEDIAARCLACKLSLVARDARDEGERRALNFGHTIGHALEAMQGYAGLTHGRAVAAGMRVMARLGERKGLTQTGTADRLDDCLARHGLLDAPPPAAREELAARLRLDKKARGRTLYLVWLSQIGRAFIAPMTAEELAAEALALKLP